MDRVSTGAPRLTRRREEGCLDFLVGMGDGSCELEEVVMTNGFTRVALGFLGWLLGRDGDVGDGTGTIVEFHMVSWMGGSGGRAASHAWGGHAWLCTSRRQWS